MTHEQSHSPRRVRRFVPLFIIVFLMSVASILTFQLLRSYADYERLVLTYHSALGDSAISNFPRYGIIQSLSTDGSSISTLMENRFEANGLPYPLTISVSPGTVIARQELTGTGTSYDTLTRPLPASYADLKVGDRVAILLRYNEDELPEALLILFGNPI